MKLNFNDKRTACSTIRSLSGSPPSFFGQWFGFYRFNGFRGIDVARFPEFDEQLKRSMHDEANAFFAYLVREDRPVDEILFADYVFWNQALARHYQLPPRPICAADR